jgi:hypothetical protein
MYVCLSLAGSRLQNFNFNYFRICYLALAFYIAPQSQSTWFWHPDICCKVLPNKLWNRNFLHRPQTPLLYDRRGTTDWPDFNSNLQCERSETEPLNGNSFFKITNLKIIQLWLTEFLLEIENNIAPEQNIRRIKLYSNTCFGEMSSKYSSTQTAFVISISARSVFIFPKSFFISPYPSNYFYYLIIQIQLHLSMWK